MSVQTTVLAAALEGIPVRIVETDYQARGFHAVLYLETGSQIRRVAEILLDQEYFMGFVTACHTDPAIQVLYQFARYDMNHRIMVRTAVDENNEIPTISDIFQGADWHERETRDFFGVVFAGHPDLEPLLLHESDRDLKPLLKKASVLKTEQAVFGQEENHV